MVRDSTALTYSTACLLLMLITDGSLAQRVKVQPEVVTYPGGMVNLRCQFPSPGQTQLTQVSWIYENTPESRTNIAVFHPLFGVSYPESPLKNRVRFVVDPTTLENPSIEITNIVLTDEGKYICEYATYPSGNEKGVTSLVVLAKPENSATTITVPAGTSSVAVARCESAKGRPPATISWITSLGGNASTPSQTLNSDNTVTISSQYWLVPTPADNGKDISCKVEHRTLNSPDVFPMKLVVEYPPQVQIIGYDSNWYIGRTNAELTCQADGNPTPTTVTWKTLSGPMPESVEVNQNKLTVRNVDEAVNATFICEVMNRLGSGKDQVTAHVRETPLPLKGAATGGIIGGIIAAILIIALISVGVVYFYKKRNNADGPPTHKPPPPVKYLKTPSENLSQPTANADPMSEMPLQYYETQKAEPVTDLDSYHGEDEDFPRATSVQEDKDMPHVYYEYTELDQDMHGDGLLQSPSDLTRGDSFVSSAVIV